MAIFGIGTDIIALARIEKSIERHGDKFALRILSGNELVEFDAVNKKSKANFLAKRFAAKEAISKALGTGMRNGIDFVQFSISHDTLGKPMVTLSGKARQWAQKNHIHKIQLTLSDEKDYAVAFAIAESVSKF